MEAYAAYVDYMFKYNGSGCLLLSFAIKKYIATHELKYYDRQHEERMAVTLS